MEKELKKLKELLDIQCSDGNWNFDPYMHGMANGMIFCVALLEDKEPVYLEAPKKWGYKKGQADLELGSLEIKVRESTKQEQT